MSGLFRDRDYRIRYGLTEAEVDALIAAQNGLCAVCEVEPSTRLNVDHDHVTKVVRGLLCRSCNLMLGFAGDCAERLRKAADYLEACDGNT